MVFSRGGGGGGGQVGRFAAVGRQGYYRDAEVGLYALGMGAGAGRAYDPLSARFLSRDPLGEAGGSANPYLYCGNDPVNRTDPSGNELIAVGDGALSDVLWQLERVLGWTGAGEKPVYKLLPDDGSGQPKYLVLPGPGLLVLGGGAPADREGWWDDAARRVAGSRSPSAAELFWSIGNRDPGADRVVYRAGDTPAAQWDPANTRVEYGTARLSEDQRAAVRALRDGYRDAVLQYQLKPGGGEWAGLIEQAQRPARDPAPGPGLFTRARKGLAWANPVTAPLKGLNLLYAEGFGSLAEAAGPSGLATALKVGQRLARSSSDLLDLFSPAGPIVVGQGVGHVAEQVGAAYTAYRKTDNNVLVSAVGGAAFGAAEVAGVRALEGAAVGTDVFTGRAYAADERWAMGFTGATQATLVGGIPAVLLLRGTARAAAEAPAAPKVPKWDIHERVPAQLNDPRMGRLQGKLTADDLNRLANNPNARVYWDARSNNINIIQEVDGKLLRITVARDKTQIISVGPVQERNITNSVGRGDWIDMKK